MRLRDQLGPALRALRTSRGWSQEQLARKANWSKQGVSQLELGQRGELLDHIDDLLHLLGGEARVYVTSAADGVGDDELGAALRALEPAHRAIVWDLIRAIPSLSEDTRDLIGHAARQVLDRLAVATEPDKTPQSVIKGARR